MGVNDCPNNCLCSREIEANYKVGAVMYIAMYLFLCVLLSYGGASLVSNLSQLCSLEGSTLRLFMFPQDENLTFNTSSVRMNLCRSRKSRDRPS